MRRAPLQAHEIAGRDVVRVDDLAAILDVTPAYVRKCIACGTLRAVKVGNKHRIPADEAIRYLVSLGVRVTHAMRATA